MNLLFTFYRRIEPRQERWTLLGAPLIRLSREGKHAAKLDLQLRESLRKTIEETPAHLLPGLTPALSTALRHVRLELNLTGELGRRTVSGRCPLVCEERRIGERATMTLIYHPEHKQHWFELKEGPTLEEQATRFFQHAFRDMELDELALCLSTGRDRLHTIGISAEPKPLKLPSERKQALRIGGAQKPVLGPLAVDRTRAVEGLRPHDLGTTRSPYREQLAALLCGPKKRSAIVVGESGVGKSTLIEQGIWDLLASEDYPIHRNLDRVHHVYQLSARQLIAGMSYRGEWEQRCFDLFAEVKKKRAILAIPDLAAFGRTGQSRESERSLADVFKGPIARGELVVIGELTPSELARLEEDAPSFAALFSRVLLPKASAGGTLPMMLAVLRNLEAEHELELEPEALVRLLELRAALATERRLPGSAVDALRRLVRESPRGKPVTARQVLSFMAADVSVPEPLLDRDTRISHAELRARLESRVLGQPAAIAAACDVIARVKAGLSDPRRPHAALLFVGPTGTGKTELAKALAAELYGSARRLLRFDMGEYGGFDALERLVGGAGAASGALTQAIAQQPFSVVLLDEIEKAHPSVFPLLLQLLDEARLTDAAGRTVSFHQAVVIMTSNLGAQQGQAVGFSGAPALHASRDAVRAAEQFFAPELFNRIDEVVSFVPLTLELAARIVERELTALCMRPGLRDRHCFVVTEPAAIQQMAEQAFRAEEGARSLRRFLEDRVGSVLAEVAAASSESALRVIHVAASEAGFVVTPHALVEAEEIAARYGLAELLGKPAVEVRRVLPRVVDALDRLAESPELPKISAHISRALSRRQHDSALFTLESFRGELVQLRDRLARLLEDETVDTLREALETDYAIQRDVSGRRTFTALRARVSSPTLSHVHLSELVARAYFYCRSLARALLPDMHTIQVELLSVTPVGRHSASRLLEQLALAYADSHGELDGFAVHAAGSGVQGESADALREALERGGVTCAVLRMTGLCVSDFFAPEAGIHVLQSASSEPELVRVQLRPLADAESLADALEQLERSRRAASCAELFVAQVTRIIRYDAARDGGASWLWLEDYPHAYLAEQRVSGLAQALAPLWRMRMSREDP